MEGALDAHRQVDELRFNAISAAMLKLEASFDALQAEVRDGFASLGAAIQQIELRLAATGEGGAKTHWRIGPFGQWAMGVGALAALALIGWMAAQLWIEEPARVRGAQLLADPPAAGRADIWRPGRDSNPRPSL